MLFYETQNQENMSKDIDFCHWRESYQENTGKNH